MSVVAVGAVGLVLAGLCGGARAQLPNPCIEDGRELRCLDLQLFVPTTSEGTSFSVDRAAVVPHLSLVFGVATSYASGVLRRDFLGESDPVVRGLWQSELMATLGLFEVLELGVSMPAAHIDVADDVLADDPSFTGRWGLGDLRVQGKVPFIRGDFALAARLAMTLPTGDSTNFLGLGYWTLVPGVVMGAKVGPLDLGGMASYRFRRRAALGLLEQNNEIDVSAGASMPVVGPLSGVSEVVARIGLGGRTLRANEVPVEARLGVRLQVFSSLSIEGGAGVGILAGYGSPVWRALFAARFATEPELCEAGPEDFDGFEDGDFCADVDNDQDGVLDTEDGCPNDPEDKDGVFDGDGCPDPDHDGDGIEDGRDRCRDLAEDFDGYRDEDGCPEKDNDEDGIADGFDGCPMDPEDRDEFQDEDGCPEPGPERAVVTVTDSRILISERIYFDFDQDTIRSVSKPILDQVADVMREIDPKKVVQVAGYSDDEGEDRYNLDLSYRRARAVVEYLAARGIARGRLSFEGYGSASPVAPNDSPEGRALNRRVEFTIMSASQAKGIKRGRRRVRGRSRGRR